MQRTQIRIKLERRTCLLLNIYELEIKREQRRSNVRICVTYASIGMYLLLASIVIIWLMWAGRQDVAIGVGGVAGLAGSITGFWFGARKPADPSKNGPKNS